MFDVAQSLGGALTSAADRLGGDAAGTARAATPYGSARSDAPMASAAQNAIFTEALLNAIHARLAEIKVAAHG